MAGKQINPILIQALTNQEITEIPSSPTFKYLGGTYVKSVVDNFKKVMTQHEKNEIMMTCKSCNKSGKYNIGTMFIKVPTNNQNIQKPEQQYTGYFRCKHCNTAGQWEESSELYMFSIAALLAPDNENNSVQFGEMQLFDGTSPKYATDGEEHLLHLISSSPSNALLWNKLGNLYITGARPELAIAAFEKSIAIDPNQIESHLSIANILKDIKDYQHTIHHLHQMMLSAEHYEHLNANRLRELLAYGICTSFITSVESKQKYSPLPTKEQVMSADREINLATEELLQGIELYSDDVTSFYPLAEAFMGKRAQELN
ncbi:tetratricopeptide (TPR) repeat protein [Lysinibacillus sp. RC46]|uniref:tetratricopeptide repeat protein n=1 Tax=unclassified Lysinibacillus TaxID=2636778 RepID=UPI0035157D11